VLLIGICFFFVCCVTHRDLCVLLCFVTAGGLCDLCLIVCWVKLGVSVCLCLCVLCDSWVVVSVCVCLFIVV
jgi:hypothetical protein